MTLAQMRLEVRSRLNGPGYRFLSDTRINTFINDASHALDEMYLWPYREASVTGTAPLAIADLPGADAIEAVVNTSQSSYPLTKLDWRTLLDTHGDLSVTGDPRFYYVAWPTGTPEVATYPVTTDTIGVQYWKVTADLVSDSDSPACPTRWHRLVVDMATQLALRAGRNRVGRYLQFAEADSLDGPIQQQIQSMLSALTPGLADYTGTYLASPGQDF